MVYHGPYLRRLVAYGFLLLVSASLSGSIRSDIGQLPKLL
jgi:hypothetical protein